MEIRLTQGKIAIIDHEDWPLVAPYKWYAKLDRSTGRFYAYNKSHRLIMHRLILGARKGELVDHRDRDGLNNRRDNLRFSDKFRNQMNRGKRKGASRYKGVSWYADGGRWVVRFNWLGKYYYVGSLSYNRKSWMAV